ncbi:divalent metal cation transporter [Flavobacteriaceae bacterium]|nr:divalent metal cation transporter [Flavobacteriaceae bacterium]
MIKLINFFKFLGPGIIAASAAIGTSHLIQSTRAGGYFGFELLWVVIVINIIKYPFIEYGFRYSAVKKENLLQGYNRLSPKLLIIFLIINAIAAIGCISAVSYIGAGILKSIINTEIAVNHLSLIIIVASAVIIIIGRYEYLDNIMKIFMVILLIATSLAAILAFSSAEHYIAQPFYDESAWSWKHLPFIIALMGWMPAPIEISVWYSLWLEAKNKEAEKLNFQKARLDFNCGYFLMIITAIFFVSMGALILHNSTQEISNNAVIFSSQLISSYVSVIGNWSKPIISVAILAAILSTVLVVVDAYPRSISAGILILRKKENNQKYSRILQNITIASSCALSFIVIEFFVRNFKSLIDVVTILAFISAPLFAYMNYRLVNNKTFPEKYQPKKWLKILSYVGFIYMVFFCIVYLYSLASFT